MAKLQSPINAIPGVDPVYDAIIFAEIDDIGRFPSGKQIVSYVGIDATVNDFGDFKGASTPISKRGSSL